MTCPLCRSRCRKPCVYIPSALLLAYYRRQAEYWQAEAEAQRPPAASLQASLCKVLGEIEELGLDTQAKARYSSCVAARDWQSLKPKAAQMGKKTMNNPTISSTVARVRLLSGRPFPKKGRQPEKFIVGGAQTRAGFLFTSEVLNAYQ